MTTSKIINASELSAYERWELPLVSGDRVSSFSNVKELGSIQKQAYEEGFAQGHNEGFEQGKDEVERHVRSLNSIMELLADPLSNIDDDIVLQLSHLAMLVAKQVIRRELRIDEGEIIGIIRESLTALPSTARNVILHIHPEDAVLVRNVFSMGEETGAEAMLWKIVEDPLLARGGCKLNSDNSRIDATIESRLNRVINTLLGDERESDG